MTLVKTYRFLIMVTIVEQLKDLQGIVKDIIKSLNGLESWDLEYGNGNNVPMQISTNELLDIFKHMQGWVDCMVDCQGKSS